jgi:hypothetical protein
MQKPFIYQDILNKGNKQGAERMINSLLNQRFNQIDTSLIERSQALSPRQLENLAEALFDFIDVSNSENLLEQQASN